MKRVAISWLGVLAALCLPWNLLEASFISDSVKGDLVQLTDGEVRPVPAGEGEAALGKAKLIALYFSAHWCPPCRKFTPELVEFYKNAKKDNPDFELVFVSYDRSPDALADYVRSTGMPWPAVAFGKGEELKRLYSGKGIPRLVLVNPEGKVLADSYEGEKYVGPRHVLKEIEKQLKSAPVASAPAP